MANWAYNSVTFQGEVTKIEEINTMFETMCKCEKLTNEGQLPFFVIDDDGYFFKIRINEKEDEVIEIHYETKWSPNLSVLIEIANHFNVDFEVSYNELACCVFGKATYIAGSPDAEINDLDFDDFYIFEGLKDKDGYLYNNKEWYDLFELLESIHDEKFNQVMVEV